MIAKKVKHIVEDDLAGLRLDKALVQICEGLTREYAQKLILNGEATVNGMKSKSSSKLKVGDVVWVNLPEPVSLDLKPKEIPLDIVFEDKELLVINKQPGLVVHPADGGRHVEDSLVNAVLFHCGNELSGIGGVMRPGIVHRLDKDTSGLMVVAKTEVAQQHLMSLFKKREVGKIYTALLVGNLPHKSGVIEAAIGRDKHDRKRMAIGEGSGGLKEAKTGFEVLKHLNLPEIGQVTLVKVELFTGRTHQIRVHFASIGFPLAGDAVYGDKKANKLFERRFSLRRQFLHASELIFQHPASGRLLDFKVELPSDLSRIVN